MILKTHPHPPGRAGRPIWAIRWCDWPARSIVASVHRVRANVPAEPAGGRAIHPFILKHMHNLSDEVLCARCLENPYYQFFLQRADFCHRPPFDRVVTDGLRLGEEQLVALILESLSVAHKDWGAGDLRSRMGRGRYQSKRSRVRVIAHWSNG